MGSYVSIPFVSRKVVQLEPAKKKQQEDVVTSAEKEEVEVVEVEVEEKEEKKEEKVWNEDPMDVVLSKLTIQIPEESPLSVAPLAPAARVPEFRGTTDSESHAMKKFNRRHRK